MNYVFFSNDPIDKEKRSLFENVMSNNVLAVKKIIENSTNKTWEYKNSNLKLVLHIAVCDNSYIMAETIINCFRKKMNDLDFIAYLNKILDNSMYFIHEIALNGNLDMLKLFIDNGADVNVKNQDGINCLHIASQTDKLNIIIYLVEILALNPFSLDNSKRTPLHWACYFGAELCVKYLTSKTNNLDTTSSINYQDCDGYGYLHLSVLLNKENLIKFLLYNRININLLNKKNQTALDLAKEKNYQSVIELMKVHTEENCIELRPKINSKKSNANIYAFFTLYCVYTYLLLIYILPCKYLLLNSLFKFEISCFYYSYFGNYFNRLLVLIDN